MHAGAPKLQWRMVAVTSADPVAFARELESALQELTDNGYAINGQMQRGEALVISASRLIPTEAVMSQRRVVDVPLPRQSAATIEEVLYHFLEKGTQKQRIFPTLIAALRVLQVDLKRADILPINIMTLTTTRFEAESFAGLLKTFANALRTPLE